MSFHGWHTKQTKAYAEKVARINSHIQCVKVSIAAKVEVIRNSSSEKEIALARKHLKRLRLKRKKLVALRLKMRYKILEHMPANVKYSALVLRSYKDLLGFGASA